MHIERLEAGTLRDIAIIFMCEKIDHFEIAAYGSLCALARTMRKHGLCNELQQTLDEEKASDRLLEEIAAKELQIDQS